MAKAATLLVVSSILILLIMTGCSKPVVPATVPVDASATEQVAAPAAGQEATHTSTAEVNQDANMEALILEKLQGHHSIDVVLNAKKTREQWVTTLDRMIAKGALISDEEKTVIIEWLLSRKN